MSGNCISNIDQEMGLVNGVKNRGGIFYEENRHFLLSNSTILNKKLQFTTTVGGLKATKDTHLKYLSFYHGQLRFTNRKVWY